MGPCGTGLAAQHSGTLRVHMLQAAFASTLTLYSGSALNNLNQVACGDPITVPITQGQTYFLQIGNTSVFGLPPNQGGTFVVQIRLDTLGLPDLAPGWCNALWTCRWRCKTMGPMLRPRRHSAFTWTRLEHRTRVIHHYWPTMFRALPLAQHQKFKRNWPQGA
jgi:hypothetical protein